MSKAHFELGQIIDTCILGFFDRCSQFFLKLNTISKSYSNCHWSPVSETLRESWIATFRSVANWIFLLGNVLHFMIVSLTKERFRKKFAHKLDLLE